MPAKRLPMPSVAELVKLAPDHPSLASLARAIGVKPSTLVNRLNQDTGGQLVKAALGEPEEPGDASGITHQPDGSIIIVSAPCPDDPPTPESQLAIHGIEEADYRITRVKANSWNAMTSDKASGDNRIVVMRQLTVEAKPTASLICIPDPAGWKPPPKPRLRKRQPHVDAVVISDHHAPHHEPTFHRLFLEMLRDEQPDLIDVNGDLLDFSTISRHREREAYAQPVNECLAAGFGILRDYREVCPDAKIRLKRGNHEERLLHLILDNARGLHNITPADDETPALSLRRLLHLDELHIEYVDQEWDQAKSKLSPKLTARHGFSTSKNAGEMMLDKLSGSTVQGHDHRAGMTFRTEHSDGEEELRVRMAMQGGCACIIPGGLGYVTGGEPNWQNLYSAFRVWPDGDFHAAFGLYVPGRLLAANGKRYRA